MINPINLNKPTLSTTTQAENKNTDGITDTKNNYVFLSGAICRRVIEESIQILGEIGLAIENKEAISLLHRAGAKVDGGRVYVTEKLVKEALKTAPSCVRVYNRDGNPAMELGGNNIYFTPGSAALRILDSESGIARTPITADLKAFAKLTDALPHYTAQSTGLVPSDVPPDIADSYRLYIALLNSPKPVITGTFRKESFAVMRDLLTIVAGSKENLQNKPSVIFDCCPSSPLKWGDDQIETLIKCAEAGLPAEIVPAPLTGATAPVTLIGAVTQHCAENLGGLVIHQLAAPGAPVIYGGCGMSFDMRHGTSLTGAAETMMLQSACAEVGKYLGLPTHGYLGLSDAKLPDYQAGMESAAGLLTAVRSGINNIAGPGMLEYINCQSLEKLVLDHEICGMIKRFTSGIVLSNDFLALPIISEGIKQGEFLSLAHTVKQFRKEMYFPSEVIDRTTRDEWQTTGGKDAWQRAKHRVQELLSRHTPQVLSEHIVANLTKRMEQECPSLPLTSLK